MWLYFLIALVLITIIDFVWLGLLMSNFYVQHLGELGRKVDGEFKPLLPPAVIVYLLLAFGICYFVLNAPGNSLVQTFTRGALLGLVVYGVYDMTNLATLTRWPLPMVAVDMAWGAVLCGTVALLTQIIGAKLA